MRSDIKFKLYQDDDGKILKVEAQADGDAAEELWLAIVKLNGANTISSLHDPFCQGPLWDRFYGRRDS